MEEDGLVPVGASADAVQEGIELTVFLAVESECNMCITPITKKREYRTYDDSNAKGAPGIAHQVPCGYCVQCLRRRQNDWSFRLSQEMKSATSAFFITLTYETAPLSKRGFPTLVKSDLQKFIKRLRKLNTKTPYIKKNGTTGYKSNIKYYACGEYGTLSNRPHYHAIMFNVDSHLVQVGERLDKIWNRGITHSLSGNPALIAYTTKYLMSGRWEPEDIVDTESGEIIEDDRQPQFAVMSKNLGKDFLTPQMVSFLQARLESIVTLPGGQIQAMPRYYRDRVFNQSQKKIINQAQALARELSFTEIFNDDYSKELLWKKDQIRKQEKAQKYERAKI